MEDPNLSDSSDSSSEEDEDYKPDDQESGSDEVEEEKEEEPDPEKVDKLWNEFLAPIKEKETKKEDVKKVVKNYEFAGEKVSTSPPDSAKPSSSGPSYTWNDREPSENSGITRFGGQRITTNEDDFENHKQIDLLIDEEGNPLPPPIKRGGLSYLSGEAEQIGLTGYSGRGGLSNFLACLKNSKRQKLGTLEKSRMDWESFKRDAGIEEELQTQIKSKTGYLERQDFLQRSDLRTFEIEKNVRTKTRRHP